MKMIKWNFLGDWVTPRRPNDSGGPWNSEAAKFINNCYYLYAVRLAAKIAAILGMKTDAAKYESAAVALQKALHRRFFDGKRGYVSGEQPYLAFPLLVNIVPPDLRKPVMQNLEETILVKNSGHIDAGMHGAYFLLKYLMEQDRNDLIYAMVSKTDYPSWGDMLRQGATTIWEDWSGGSHIHDTLISIGSWFIQGIGGIRIDETRPGFKHFLIRPGVVGDLTFARVRYRSPYGLIVSNWIKENGVLHLDVTVPAGTTATVYVPAASPAAVTEGGRPIRPAAVENGKAKLDVGSGQYQFTSKLYLKA
jgi:alpha-L-rhamnosidase